MPKEYSDSEVEVGVKTFADDDVVYDDSDVVITPTEKPRPEDAFHAEQNQQYPDLISTKSGVSYSKSKNKMWLPKANTWASIVDGRLDMENPAKTEDAKEAEEALMLSRVAPQSVAAAPKKVEPKRVSMTMMVPGVAGTWNPVVIPTGGVQEHMAAVTNAPAQVGAGLAKGMSGLSQMRGDFIKKHPVAANIMNVMGVPGMNTASSYVENLGGANKKLGALSGGALQELEPESTSAQVVNFAAKLPLELGKFAAQGPYAPLGMALESAGNRYIDAKNSGATDGEAARAAGLDAAIAGVLGKLPGIGPKAQSVARVVLNKLTRGLVLGTTLHGAEAGVTWTYNPDEALKTLANPKALAKSILHMMGFELASVPHGISEIPKPPKSPAPSVPEPARPAFREATPEERANLIKPGERKLTSTTPEEEALLLDAMKPNRDGVNISRPGESPAEIHARETIAGLEMPQPEPPKVMEPAKASDALAREQLTPQDEITTLRENRVRLQNELEAARADMEKLRQAGRRGKSEEWSEANARLNRLTDEVVKADEQLALNTGKTYEELQGEPAGVTPEGMSETASRWAETQKTLSEIKAENRGRANMGIDPTQAARLVVAAAKDGYRNVSEWLADMRTKMGEDFKAFYQGIGGLEGASRLWDEHALGLKPGESRKPVNTQSREFQEWSGGKEIKDAEGKPARFYHGTLDEFDGFSPSRRGIFFSTDPAFASKFGQGNDGRVIPAYIKAEKPFDYKSPKDIAEFNAWLESKNAKEQFHNGEPAPDVEAGNWAVMESHPFQQFLKEKGYDAYYVVENGARNIAVIDPKQIKSSLTNTGEYSKDSGMIADNLGLQQVYEAALGKAKEKLGLEPTASEAQVAQEVIGRIGRIGSTVRETAVRIMAKIKGISRQLADQLAEWLHSTEEGQRGAVGGGGKKGKDEYVNKRRSAANLPRIESKWNPYNPNDEFNRGIVSEPSPEPTKPADWRDEIRQRLPGEENKAARAAEYAKGAPKPPTPAKVPNGNALIKQQGEKLELGDWLKALDEGSTGSGLMNPDGSKRITRPFMDFDPTAAAESAKREMNLAERIHGRTGSPSHTYTTFGGWFADSPGVMKMGNNPATDIRIAEMSSFGNTLHVRGHIEDGLVRSGIEWNKGKDELYKALAPSREALAKAHENLERAQEAVKRGFDKGVADARLSQAQTDIRIANGQLDAAMAEVLAKPDQSGARVMLGADYKGRGEAFPEWLKLSESEQKAADMINTQMREFERAMAEEGIPVRADAFGVPHYFTPGLKSSTQRRLKNSSSLGGELSLNPENIRFMHRGENSRLTIPDLGLLLEDYIPRANYLIAKKAVASKWNAAAADIDMSGKPHLADKIRRDMKDYTEGNSNQLAWMDQMNRIFASILTGFRTSTAVKHAMKFPLELAQGRPVQNFKGYLEWRKAASSNPELQRVMRELTTISKGPRYNKNPDIGVGEKPTDKPQNLLEEVENVSHFPMQWVEGGLRGVTFKYDTLGAYKRGLTPQQALADVFFRKLMANFEATDKPVLLRTPLGRSAFFLQQTVTKIMELNMRAIMDTAKAGARQVGSRTGGKPVSPEEYARQGQAFRHMLALATIAAIGQKTNTPIFEWVTETPAFAKVMAMMVKLSAKVATSKVTGKKTKESTNVSKDLFGGLPSVFPLVEQAIDSSKKYGTFSKAFAVDTLTPGFIKDVTIEPRGDERKKWGRGEEARFRRFTGLFKEKEAIKLKEKRDKEAAEREQSAAKRYEKSLKPGPRFKFNIPPAEGEE